MTPHDFIAKWRNVELNESHYNDHCRLIAVDDPIAADPKGEWFPFADGEAKDLHVGLPA